MIKPERHPKIQRCTQTSTNINPPIWEPRNANQATCNFLTEVEAFELLDASLNWSLQWWCLDCTERPLPFLLPNLVCVLPLHDHAVSFWPPSTHSSSSRHHTASSTSASDPHASTTGAGSSSSGQVDVDMAGHPMDRLTSTTQWSDVAAAPLSDDEEADLFDDEPIATTGLLLRAALLSGADADALLGEMESQALPRPDADAHAAGSSNQPPGPPNSPPNLEGQPSSSSAAPPAVVGPAQPQAVQPKAAVPRAPAVRGVAGLAEVTMEFDQGRISYYAGKEGFEAVCRNPAHGPGRCVIFRTSRPHNVRGLPTKGRPLGFLLTWLRHNHVASKEMHKAPANLQFSHEMRSRNREELESSEQGRRLLALERPVVEGEDAEPLTLQGYV